MPVKVVLREINKIGFPLTLSQGDSQHSIPYSPSSQRIRLRGRRTEDLVRRYNQIASDDIYASSRLSGYLFIFTAYCVLFVSSFQAKNSDQQVQNDLTLSTWKFWCTFYGSLGFMITMIVTIAAHFDTFLCPQLWRCVFKLGSKGECAVLAVLVAFAIFMVYCSTSTNGLGGFAALNYNVYFSSWAGLVACSYTMDLWLTDSAKVRTLKDRLRKSAVKTNYNWACTLFFSVVTLLSQLDTMIVTQMIQMKSSQIMLLSSGASVGCCLVAMILNACCSSPRSHWHKLEGVLLVALSSFWTWVVVRFTGAMGLINGPSNNYFGVWGTFFYSISTFGVWLKENKPFCGNVSS